jgi:triacylglycerol lipase
MNPKRRTLPSLSDALTLNPKHVVTYFPPSADEAGAFGPNPYEFFRDSSLLQFDAQSPGYSRINAWLLSDLSFLAYTTCDTPAETEDQLRPVLERVFEPASFGVKVFHGKVPVLGTKVIDNKIQCIVAHDVSKGIVAFGGTLSKSLGNWLTDVEFQLVDEHGPIGLRVHRGFKDGVDSVWPDLLRYLTSVPQNGQDFRWWFTGHSLGAALATVAVRRFGRAHALYTYGSPRTGNATFAKDVVRSVMGRCYRVVNHEDIVTHVPPTELDDWAHAGRVMYFEDHDRTPSLLQRFIFATRHLFGRPRLIDEATRSLFHAAGHLKEEYVDHLPLRPCIDHAPVFYSKVLWNDFVAATAGRRRD